MANPSTVELSVNNGVGGWAWNIYVIPMHIAVPLLQLKKGAPSYFFIAVSRKLLMIVHWTCNGPLSDGCFSEALLGSADAMLR